MIPETMNTWNDMLNTYVIYKILLQNKINNTV